MLSSFVNRELVPSTLWTHGRKSEVYMHFVCQDSGLSQIFKLITPTSETEDP